ncbi:hypothetical protein [Paenibacillus sp. UMB4589-SE434]|uniref:hypothetical protein n=1 Tax=Paenibacillus sp. UMB4589-SE434 TaxID=3046314 RepID=UPI00254CCEA1|nr:hypothetical protein [Paenibacillus sp. UMB4589-SE434]MDK8182135.1 hypothetical protein [Paenibacillus sp. UMB4589-SE434]
MEIVIAQDPREIIKSHISFSARSKLSNLVIDAYKWSELLINNTAAFKTLRGQKRLLPEIKNVAVEFFIIQAVKNKELPFLCRSAYNSNRSHTYLELYNEDTLIHFNQVSSKNKCGRKAVCRDRVTKPLESYIDYSDNINPTISVDSKNYFQVNHGYQTSTPSFITLGIPNGEGILNGSIPLLQEFVVVEGFYPKSKIQTVDEISFEDFQRYAEGDGLEDVEKQV